MKTTLIAAAKLLGLTFKETPAAFLLDKPGMKIVVDRNFKKDHRGWSHYPCTVNGKPVIGFGYILSAYDADRLVHIFNTNANLT